MGTSMWGWQMKECGNVLYCPMEDPDYQVIEGAWLNEEPYGVVHRITSDGTVKGSGIRMPYMGLWAVRQSEDRYAPGQCGDAEYAEEKWFSILWNHPCPGWIRTSGISEDEVKSIEYKGRI